jgi:hypothetical protein
MLILPTSVYYVIIYITHSFQYADELFQYCVKYICSIQLYSVKMCKNETNS